MYMFFLCICFSLSLAENWWALDGENCFKALKVMEDNHTTSTSLGEKLLYIAYIYIVSSHDCFGMLRGRDIKSSCLR